MNIIYIDSTSLLMLSNYEDAIDTIISRSKQALIIEHMNIIYADSTSLLMLNNHEDVIDIIISWSQLELITQHMNIIYTDSTSQLMLKNHEDVTDIIQVFINSFSTRKYSSRCPNGTKMTGEKSHECTSFRWSTHWERQIFGVCCDQM